MKRLFALLIALFWSLPVLKDLEAKRRRARYEFLKAEIVKRHLGGYKGLIVRFPGRRFDIQDIACFKAPMYFSVKNQDGHWCIFWDRARMVREVGTGAELQPGEELIPDTRGRSKPQAAPDEIDDKQPLTHRKDGLSDGAEET